MVKSLSVSQLVKSSGSNVGGASCIGALERTDILERLTSTAGLGAAPTGYDASRTWAHPTLLSRHSVSRHGEASSVLAHRPRPETSRVQSPRVTVTWRVDSRLGAASTIRLSGPSASTYSWRSRSQLCAATAESRTHSSADLVHEEEDHILKGPNWPDPTPEGELSPIGPDPTTRSGLAAM